MNPLLVEVMRGRSLESSHAGAIVVVDAEGRVACSMGDIERPVFPRSAVKVLQALPLIVGGAADALSLSDAELALACASHGGEPAHADTAAGLLAKLGLDDSALECGTHWPMNESAARRLSTPSALHNNCSGKHAGFLCVACGLQGVRGDALQAFARGYIRPDHPVMREVTAALERATGVDLTDAPCGTDGCSIPTYAMPLRVLAQAFARLGAGVGWPDELSRAATRLRAAVAREPFMVAGTGRFDTLVMERLNTRVFCKVGAEGVYCAALPDAGLGIAIKIDDGNNARAAEVVMAAAVEALIDLDDAEAVFIRSFSERTLINWNGIDVGRIAAADGLRAALRAAH